MKRNVFRLTHFMAVVLTVIMAFSLVGCGKTQNGPVNGKQNSGEQNSGEEQDWDADVLRCLQGKWVLEKGDDYYQSFSISGRDCSIYTDISTALGSASGTKEYHLEPGDVDGEIIIYRGLHNTDGDEWDEEYGRLYYKYDKANDSLELTYDGNILKKEN